MVFEQMELSILRSELFLTGEVNGGGECLLALVWMGLPMLRWELVLTRAANGGGEALRDDCARWQSPKCCYVASLLPALVLTFQFLDPCHVQILWGFAEICRGGHR